jgi:hypothetical protein
MPRVQRELLQPLLYLYVFPGPIALHKRNGNEAERRQIHGDGA